MLQMHDCSEEVGEMQRLCCAVLGAVPECLHMQMRRSGSVQAMHMVCAGGRAGVTRNGVRSL